MIVTGMKVMTHLPVTLKTGLHATTAESVTDVETFAGPCAQFLYPAKAYAGYALCGFVIFHTKDGSCRHASVQIVPRERLELASHGPR
jgi:hypothetical protein